MTVIGQAYVKVGADTKGFEKDLDPAHRGVNNLGASVKKLALGIGAAFAARAAVDFAQDSVKAFVEAEAASLKLQDAFSKFPALAGANVKEFEKLNSALAKKTRFDDDATAAAQANLAQFGVTGDQLKALTPLVQDFAARTGKDLPSAADAIGKALLGQGRALKEVGIDFQDTGNFAGNLEQVMVGLRTQVGGFAEKEGASAAGKAEILKNQMGELKERLGGALIPVLQGLGEVLLKVVTFFTELEGPTLRIVQVAGVLIGVLTALNFVLAANPIGIVVIAIAALAAGLVMAYKKSETFREVVQFAFQAVKNQIQLVVNVFDAVWQAIKKVIEFVGKLIDKFRNFKLPDWATPGSPSPFEESLTRTLGLLKQLGAVSAPVLAGGAAGGGRAAAPSGPINVTINGAQAPDEALAFKVGTEILRKATR